MKVPLLTKYGIVSVILIALLFELTSAKSEPKERIDYWQNSYYELSPETDTLARRVHDIFNKLLSVAGSRQGVIPRLFIIKNDPFGKPLAISIPDGGIIISKGTMDICYANPIYGDDRIAFILSHEIAHQIKDDFWHMKFFQAIEESENPDTDQKVLSEVRSIAELTNQVMAKELQADEHAVIYSTMAGFNPDAIINDDVNDNFFEFWLKSVDPSGIPGVKKDPTHPTPSQRVETIKTRLKQVIDKTDLFKIGLMYYLTDNFETAAVAFEEFLLYFPSREVYHNLATCYHQLAIENYKKVFKAQEEELFCLSVAIDFNTIAEDLRMKDFRQPQSISSMYKMYIKKAIELYETVIDMDKSYILAYNNLGCALILNEEYYKACGVLNDAYELDSTNLDILNNIGVSYYFVNNIEMAKQSLKKAINKNPGFSAPLFNLGLIASKEDNEADKKTYWSDYLYLDSISAKSDFIRESLNLQTRKPLLRSKQIDYESIIDVSPGDYLDDGLPEGWDKVVYSKYLSFEEYPCNMRIYDNNVLTLTSNQQQILMLKVLDGFKQSTSGGIKIGSSKEDILEVYGLPTKKLNISLGECWNYDDQNISFVITGDTVDYWILYR